nr:GrpB family protein [Lysinibacillus cavernae]
MQLGLKGNEVKLVPYDQEWKCEFQRVRANIMEQSTIESDRIQHIGSTSIEGIQAKPIVDILIGVDNLEQSSESLLKKLRNIGFYRLRVKRPNEIVCAKFTDDTFEVKTHFIHIVNFQGEKWHDLLFFRDFLNNNDSVKKQYETLKASFLKNQLNGIEEYTLYKEQFVQSIVNKRHFL